jgi:signal transduction histidine kinase
MQQHHAITADRMRISSEMHDDLGSGLSKISMLSDTINKDTSEEEIKHHLSTISRSSKEMVETMGDIIWSMNAKNDHLANLIAYIRKYSMEFFETTSIQCIVILPETIPPILIDGVLRRNVFLVVKEALHNVLKHSACDTVTMKFEIHPHSFSILIHDNGKGIDQLKISEFGNGLINMEKRMNTIGGKFSIRNQDGTIIEISIPFKT